jgi:peptidyl-prolyl cis-trans isomerase B (cyclophilin B)
MRADKQKNHPILLNRKMLYFFHTCTHLKEFSLAFIICSFLITTPSVSVATPPPFKLPPQSEINKLRTAKIITSKGTMIFTLFPEEAPWHVANFKYLADKKFYSDLPFHLFRKGYIIQGGQPRGKYNGPGYSLPPEFSRREHHFGTLGMARRRDFMNSERSSNGSQFHILLARAFHMDGSYTIFGNLVTGKEVLETLRERDLIYDVVVYVRQNTNRNK